MIFLLDADSLIDANRDYYPISRVPEFWSWLLHQGENGNIKIPLEILEELQRGNDALASWSKDFQVQSQILLDEEVDPSLVQRVVRMGYAPDLTDIEIESLGRDPFLIAYGLVDPSIRVIVTTESPKPTKIRQNKKIPDVCDSLNIHWCDTFQLIRSLDFSTGWNN